jgi:hypothetical protein
MDRNRNIDTYNVMEVVKGARRMFEQKMSDAV